MRTIYGGSRAVGRPRLPSYRPNFGLLGAGIAGYGMARRGLSAGRSLISRLRSRGASDGRAVTFQNDSALRYRRKSMPPRKRKAWKKFTRKVRHVTLQMQPLQIYTRQGTENVTSSVNAGAHWSRMCGGVNVALNNEILQCFLNAYPSFASTASQASELKLFIKSIVLDVQIRNNGEQPIIIDKYHLECRANNPQSQTVHAQYNQALGEVVPLNGTALGTTSTALTLFDAPNFLSYWKVMNKREHVIGAGQVCTFQIRMPENKYIDGKMLTTHEQSIPKFTRCMFFTWHGAPANTGSLGASQFQSTSVTFGWQTVVHFAVPPSSTVQEAGQSIG